MTPPEWVATAILLLALLTIGIPAAARGFGHQLTIDPGRAWARAVCEIALSQRGYRSRTIAVRVEQLDEWVWEITLPADGGQGLARCNDLAQVEEVLTAWWHSPVGRRTLLELERGGGR